MKGKKFSKLPKIYNKNSIDILNIFEQFANIKIRLKMIKTVAASLTTTQCLSI